MLHPLHLVSSRSTLLQLSTHSEATRPPHVLASDTSALFSSLPPSLQQPLRRSPPRAHSNLKKLAFLLRPLQRPRRTVLLAGDDLCSRALRPFLAAASASSLARRTPSAFLYRTPFARRFFAAQPYFRLVHVPQQPPSPSAARVRHESRRTWRPRWTGRRNVDARRRRAAPARGERLGLASTAAHDPVRPQIDSARRGGGGRLGQAAQEAEEYGQPARSSSKPVCAPSRRW